MKILLLTLLSAFISLSAMTQVITPEVKKRADEILKQMTLDEKIDYIGGEKIIYPGIRPMSRFGIPHIRMADGPQGIRKYDNNSLYSTLYPCGIVSASTWNRSLIEKLGVGLGQDARARGVHVLLGPGVNIYRSPLCGRNFEYFGEDPYLAGETAVSYINGVQSQKVIATIKHFAANNQEWERHNTSSDLDERTLNEIYLVPFEKAVKEANVGAVMSSYNLLNGVHTTEHPDLNIRILRNQWGFEGILMSDWGSVHSSAGPSNGGLDIEMPRGRFMNKETLMPLIKNGVVTEETINLKVRHILETIIAYGFLDREQLDTSIPLNNPLSAKAALDLAREGLVLLKNDTNTLPLSKKETILVLGPNANRCVTGGGSGFVSPFASTDVLTAMKATMGAKNVQYEEILYPVDGKTSGEFFSKKGSNEKGITANYYDNDNLAGKPIVTRIDEFIDFNWGESALTGELPKNNFSVKWTSVYKPKTNALVRFRISAVHGFRMSIDGTEILSDWNARGGRTREASICVEAGKEYDIKIEYFNRSGEAKINLAYEKVNLDNGEWITAVKKAGRILLCVGFDSITEKENQDRTFGIPAWQEGLINFVAKHNKNVTVVVNAGGGVDFSKWGGNVQAILMAWYPGQEGGQAVADILTGKISPSGRLPITIEKQWEDNPTFNSYYADIKNAVYLRTTYKEGIFVGYRGYDHFNIEPYYPFGYGLTYSTFEYKNFKIEKINDTNYSVSFDVANIGNFDAAEVPQVYLGFRNAQQVVPPKELKGYDKIFLKKGEIKRITVKLDARSFSSYDAKQQRFVVNHGDVEIMVGKSSRDIVWKQIVKL